MFASSALGTVWFADDFETTWSGDYAPGWVNADYRHGTAPVGQMMQQTSQAQSGSYGLKLTAQSTPESWMWWAAVEAESVPAWAMAKQYNPYVSVYYYDDGTSPADAGQLYAVPSWVNPYISGSEDWTDVQFGARYSVTDGYYYVAAGEGSPGWQDTGVDRQVGWHKLKFQLSSVDGKIHFYIDDAEVGQSYRDDYTDLGTAIGLYTMFQAPLSGWEDDKPYSLWDNFEIGSTVPDAGGTLLLLSAAIGGMVSLRRKPAR